MIIHFGERLYGKVDQVPGLFYVATWFVHLQGWPLLPLRSVVIIDGTENDKGYQGRSIRLSFKSIVTAWIRTALIVPGALFTIIGICEMILGIIERIDHRGPGHLSEAGGRVCVGIVLLALFWWSYRLTRAGTHRALALAAELGIPPEAVARAFVDMGRVPKADPNRVE